MREIIYEIKGVLDTQHLRQQKKITRADYARISKRIKSDNYKPTDLTAVNIIWKIRVGIDNCKNMGDLIKWLSEKYSNHLTDCSQGTLQNALLSLNQRIRDILPHLNGLTENEKNSIQKILITELKLPSTPILDPKSMTYNIDDDYKQFLKNSESKTNDKLTRTDIEVNLSKLLSI